MQLPLVSIIMRSYNEAWALKDTLAAVSKQRYNRWELIVIDSGSTDGSQELIRQAQPAHFIQIQPHEYNPGRVLNRGLSLARSNWCIFLNADATPQNSDWLGPLVETLSQRGVAAVFGKQIPRTDCEAVYACDYERCFGDKRESGQWEHFFSMVSSGLCKDIWARRSFREDIQYAEDDEYTRWCKQQGYSIRYVPDSVVMHSHNYTVQQAKKRAFGDSKAIGQAWTGSPSHYSLHRTVLMGWLSDVRHDVLYCLRKGRILELPHAMRVRWAQRCARLAGFRDGYWSRSEFCVGRRHSHA